MTTNRFGWRARSSRKKEPRLSLSVKRIGIRKTPQEKLQKRKQRKNTRMKIYRRSNIVCLHEESLTVLNLFTLHNRQ
jgi:hypothetical protein